MSRRNENWLLVEWNGGDREVVHVNSVLSPVDFKIGEMLTVSTRGGPQTATLISRAKDPDQLSSKSNEEVAGPSPKPDEEPGDYSSSGSSWAPSDDDRLSAESDNESRKKIKLEPCARQYINRRSSKKILTPSHRANAVIPKMFQNGNSKKNDVSRKRAHNGISRNESINKSLPDSTKRHNTSEVNKHMITIDARELAEISNSFRVLFRMVEELKKTMSNSENLQNHENITQIIETVDVNNKNDTDQTVFQVQEACEENDDPYEIDEEFNRSDDNVLITNKYDTQYNTSVIKQVKKAAVQPGEKKSKQDEWVPIGSGKTLIHAEQFRKVNWKSYTVATRTLLLAVFPRRVLATHSLTGKPSPAFMDKPAKMCLDPKIISDVVMEIMDRFDVKENLVRGIITTKCADECKMWKQRVNKKNKSRSSHKHNQENEPPSKGKSEQPNQPVA